MNKQLLIYAGLAGIAAYVVWDSMKVKRHWYLPVTIDAQYNAMNAVRKSLVTMQTADSMIANMRAGNSSPIDVVNTFAALEEFR